MKQFLSSFFLILSWFSSINGFSCPSASNETCLHITMYSLTDDGWNGVKLYVEFPDGGTGE